jgi:tetratricopeptide (TPR) repeat protein
MARRPKPASRSRSSSFRTDLPRFFDEDAFDDGFDDELEGAAGVEARLRASNPPFAPVVVDVTFASNDTKKLAALAKALTGMGYRMEAPARTDDGFECNGDAPPLPLSEHALVYLVADLYCRGYELDCKLTGYGAPSSTEAPDLTQTGEHYFTKAMAAFERGNRGIALALFTQALAVEPDNPNTWYSRACIADMVELSQYARHDYDKAIELAPRFLSALVNRGANKDAAGEFDAAIADYDAAIAVDAKSDAAFLNRGNSKFNQDDKAGAIADWKIAAGLGSATAKKRLSENR